MSDLDGDGMWVGPCEKCGTDHDGYPPGTLGGEMRCLRARATAEAEGTDDEQVAEWFRTIVGGIDGIQSDLDQARDDVLRKQGFIR